MSRVSIFQISKVSNFPTSFLVMNPWKLKCIRECVGWENRAGVICYKITSDKNKNISLSEKNHCWQKFLAYRKLELLGQNIAKVITYIVTLVILLFKWRHQEYFNKWYRNTFNSKKRHLKSASRWVFVGHKIDPNVSRMPCKYNWAIGTLTGFVNHTSIGSIWKVSFV